MKQVLFIYILFFTIIGFSQDSLNYYNKKLKNSLGKERENIFQKKLHYLNNQDNLEEYFYAHFDYFILHPKVENLFILAEAEKNKWRIPNTEDEKIALLHLKINRGYHYLKFSNISKSVLAYEEALQYYKTNHLTSYDIVKYCLKPLANNYTRLGDYNRADDILKYTLALAEKNANKKQQIATYLNLSITYQSLHKNKEAIKILKKALLITPITTQQKATLLSEIGKNYYELNNFKQAHIYLDASTKTATNKVTIQKNYQTNALCFIKENQLNKAEKTLQKALKSAIEIYGKNNREVAKIYILFAKVSTQKNDLNTAQKNYQNSLTRLLANYKPKDIFDHPNPNSFYAENTIYEALDGMAETFTAQKKYQDAITNYNLAFIAQRQLQNTYTSQQSKIIQQAENRERSEKIINLYYHLYQNSPKQEFVIQAFKNVEKSKALVLSDALNTKYLKESIKEDILFIKEKKLQKEKAILTKNIQIESLKNNKADLEKIKQNLAKKTAITTELQLLKKQLQQKYPFLKRSKETISVKKIKQELLVENQHLVTYFNTKNYIYIFSISKHKSLQWRRITKDSSYKKALQEYIALFANSNGDRLKNDISIYQKSAYYLYQKLMQPELENTTSKTLCIIPDGKLNFLAFDALLTQETTHTNFEKMPYLLLKNTINYGYSASILMQQKEQKKTRKRQRILGFFPVFENNYRNLQELSYTIDEEKNLINQTNGLYLKKANATKKAFLEQANGYDMIHLSTHASAGGFFEPAHIEFRNETLYLPEIYGLNLHTDLLVMSACETGIGKLQKGEGAMSLARGFSYTGVQNLLVSLWKVNDKATSILMGNFYKNYKQTHSKTEALHQAKLDYLNDKNISNSKKTPYYWSSFVLIGNSETEVAPTNFWYILIGFGIVLLVFFVSRKVHKGVQRKFNNRKLL